MIDDHKVTIVIPAGRRRYLELLIPQILAQEGWDELQVWLNTKEPDDIAYISGLPALDSIDVLAEAVVAFSRAGVAVRSA